MGSLLLQFSSLLQCFIVFLKSLPLRLGLNSSLSLHHLHSNDFSFWFIQYFANLCVRTKEWSDCKVTINCFFYFRALILISVNWHYFMAMNSFIAVFHVLNLPAAVMDGCWMKWFHWGRALCFAQAQVCYSSGSRALRSSYQAVEKNLNLFCSFPGTYTWGIEVPKTKHPVVLVAK